MKKILSVLIILALSGAYCFSQSSKVEIFTQDGEKIWVVVNGEKKNKDPLTKVVIENLTAQNYKIKVLFQDPNIPAVDKTIYTKDFENNFYNSTYVVKKDKKGNYKVNLNSEEKIEVSTTTTTSTPNANVTTTTTVSQPVQQNQTSQTTNQTTTSTNMGETQNINMGFGVNVTETPEGVDMNINMGGVNVNTSATGNENGMNSSTNMSVPGGVVSSTTSTTTTTTTTTTSSSGNVYNNANTQNQPNHQNSNFQQKPVEHHTQPAYVLPGYSGPTGCAMPMTNESFSKAKSSISSKSFEDSKMTVAKQVVGSNCLLCSQVKEIMDLFTFEDTKLEFAKFAYKHTFDIGNYYQLNDSFKFESTIDELNEYISNSK